MMRINWLKMIVLLAVFFILTMLFNEYVAPVPEGIAFFIGFAQGVIAFLFSME